MAQLICRNPATGETIQELEMTQVAELPRIFAQARAAQAAWAALTPKKRSRQLLHLREALINHVDEIADLISRENGKPRFEAMVNELLPSVDMIGYFAKAAPRVLDDHPIPMSLMKHRKSYLNYWPLGVVAVISPWNYPFLLPWGEIVMALAAGNAVVFKPSEITPLTGLKIQELCGQAGLPEHLVQVVVGDGPIGAAIIEQKPAKVFFTGSVATGKKIMAACAQHLIPVNLELGGKDAMIVLADADLDFATSAAMWGGFSNSGQVCASVERILVHENIAEQFVEVLRAKLSLLRQGPSNGPQAVPGGNDMGAVTFEKQKDIYARHIAQAKAAGARFVAGGEFRDGETRRFLQPTIVTGPQIESLDIYNEETFGPVVAVTTFKTVDEAVRKANSSKYGLLASVITRDNALGEEIARRLEVGTVTVNEVTYTAGLGETPWGGVKDSGIGRSHSAAGLLEFVNVRHIHKPRSRLFVFKSFWWFPYTPHQQAMFRWMFNLYRRSWTEKLKAFPHFVWNFVQMIKNEKRL
jgi:succinate-semialdehyde dehydrogenase/glutarate-semialdehyde dehydrogenase